MLYIELHKGSWSSTVVIEITQLMTPVDDTQRKTIQANNPELKENELHRALFDLEGLKNRGSGFIYKHTDKIRL